MEIILTRAEGPTDECGKPMSFSSFADATRQLSRWSYTAPEKGGYNKVDFTIKAESGQVEYRGRYDLKHWRVECANLRGHVIGHLEFLAGRACPSHMTPAQYDAYIATQNPEWRAECKRISELLMRCP